MKKIILLFALTITILSCNTTEPPPVLPPPHPPVQKDSIVISLVDVTHRSVSVGLQSAVVSPNTKTIKLFRELSSTTNLVAELPGIVTDTTIIDDDNGAGLLLDTTYSYYAVSFDSTGNAKDTSNTAEARTLAPTSHNYTWQEFTIGDFQSALYDVWGTDENNVWAVGIIYIDGIFYGALHYNGSTWIPDSTVGGTAVYGFAENDIWVAGGGIFHYDGILWSGVEDSDPVLHDNAPYTSLWGTSSSNLYLGNQWGKIIHWDGVKAEVVLETGDFQIRDIYGIAYNFIFTVGRNNSFSSDIIFLFNGNNWQMVSNLPINPEAPSSVVIYNQSEIYIAGNKIIFGRLKDWQVMQTGTNTYIDKIRGKNSNDLFAVGSFNEIIHYNGINWFEYTEISTPNGGRLFGVIPIGNKVFAVGHSIDIRAKIMIGTKN